MSHPDPFPNFCVRPERAEAEFQGGGNVAIVCTSTLELGIDVGDLDHVIQIGAPTAVSSVLQRMGRTGRRAGTVANCHFLCHEPEEVLRASALVRLLEQGWVEDVTPDARAIHVLAHQVMALALQEGGLSRHHVAPWVASARPFAAIGTEDVAALIRAMLERDILYESEGRLSLGAEGERRYGRQNFLDLYAVFDTPPLFHVRHGRHDIGTLDLAFLRLMTDRSGPAPAPFRLAGRPWTVRDVDWRRHVCYVEPAPHGRAPRWGGQGGYVPSGVCQAMKAVLRDQVRYPWLRSSAAMELDSLRRGYAGMVPEDRSLIEIRADGAIWHTFAGGAINALLVAALEHVSGGEWKGGNLSVSTSDPLAAASAVEAIRDLAALDLRAVAEAAARALPRGNLSKFQPCLPEAMETGLVIRRVFDVDGAAKLVRDDGGVAVWRSA